jgi:hypothetical protein
LPSDGGRRIPGAGPDVLGDLLRAGRAGDHRGNGRLGREPADRHVEDFQVALGGERFERLDLVEVGGR